VALLRYAPHTHTHTHTHSGSHTQTTLETQVAVEAPVIRQTFKLDSRDEIRLGHFGFVTGGFWNMTLNGLEMQDVRTAYSQTEATNNLVGIAFKRSTTMAGVASDLLLCTTPAEDVLSGQANPDVEFHAFTNDTTG